MYDETDVDEETMNSCEGFKKLKSRKVDIPATVPLDLSIKE